jgi:alkylhydroperoxidase/carboxymuconolactone decarboxylase family protein YurZ
MADRILSQSAFTAVINAPVEWVDIADWLLHLPDAEYQHCAPPDHVAAGYTTSDDGRPMSINVEQIGSRLVIQHYIGEVTEKHHCRMVSQSDVYTPHGRTKVQVIWDLSVKPIDAEHCEYTNSVLGLTTPEFLVFIEKNGIQLEQAAADRQAASSDHNSLETPLFAKSIERKALATKTSQAEEGRGGSTQEVSPREMARAFTPRLTQLVENPLYSDVWTDKTLSARDRSIATVAAVIALYRPEELPVHLRRAIDNGVTRDQLAALITHIAFYAGLPAAISASAIAARTLIHSTPLNGHPTAPSP